MLSISQGVPSYAVFFSPSGVNFTAEIVSSFTKWWSKVEVLYNNINLPESIHFPMPFLPVKKRFTINLIHSLLQLARPQNRQ